MTTCTTTGIRRASCACSACARGAQAADKLAANQRDVHALLSFLRRIAQASGRVRRFVRGCAAPDWSDAAEWASWRAELLDLTLRILGEGARAELEGALDIPRGLEVVGLHPRGDAAKMGLDAGPDTWCPECGPRVPVDEDGCCATCGAVATGPGASAALAALKLATEARHG